MSGRDELRRFLFEHHPVRGFWLRLEQTWSEALEHQHHPPEVRRLLGEAMAAATLLAASLKFEGTLAMQVNGEGPVRLLVAQATHDLGVRAVARLAGDTDFAGRSFRDLLGDARLTVTMDSTERGASWQGIVPLAGDSLAQCLEAYFASSEQLPTRVVLAAEDGRAGGLLLQKLPAPAGAPAGEAAEGRERALWDEAAMMLHTTTTRELLVEAPEALLPRLFAGHDLRLFGAAPVRFECRCGRPRIATVLRSLGEVEIREILAEQGAVTVTCEYCGRAYRFDRVDAAELFTEAPPTPGPGTIN